MKTAEFNRRYKPGTPVLVECNTPRKTIGSVTVWVAEHGKVELVGFKGKVNINKLTVLN